MSRSRTNDDGGNDTTGADDRLEGCRVGVKEGSDSVGNAEVVSVGGEEGAEEGATVASGAADDEGVRDTADDGSCVGNSEGTSNCCKALLG